jgi:hypothetical protein
MKSISSIFGIFFAQHIEFPSDGCIQQIRRLRPKNPGIALFILLAILP